MSLSPVQAHPFWISVLRVPSWTKLYGKLKSGNAKGDVQGKGKYQEIIYHCYLLHSRAAKAAWPLEEVETVQGATGLLEASTAQCSV